MSNEPFSSDRLKEAMNGMRNIELAAKLGCSRSNISMYLSGERTPNKMTIQLMAICLGVSPAWLAGLDVQKYIEKPAPVTESGPVDPVIDKIMQIVHQMSPEMQKNYLAQLEILLEMQEKGLQSSTPD